MGTLRGKNVELVRNKRIAQLWRGSDWPAGVFSKATFALHKTRGVTHIRFRQSGVPDTQYKAIKQRVDQFLLGPDEEVIWQGMIAVDGAAAKQAPTMVAIEFCFGYISP
jgi:activator of HSP90 ATPase